MSRDRIIVKRGEPPHKRLMTEDEILRLDCGALPLQVSIVVEHRPSPGTASPKRHKNLKIDTGSKHRIDAHRGKLGRLEFPFPSISTPQESLHNQHLRIKAR